jgi:serpin B
MIFGCYISYFTIFTNAMRTTINYLSAVSLFTVSLFLFSCTKDNTEIVPVEPVPIDLTANQIKLIESENSFAFEIFRKTSEKAAGSENLVISPLSISYALSMTLNGASGATREAMLETLRVNGLTPEIINNSYKTLSEALLSVDKRVLISIANSVWTENNFVVKKPFTDILTKYYSAEARSFDIKDPLAPRQINTWIEGKTNGLIKDMVDKLNENTVMLLINAIYFKGKWNSQFEKANTVNRSFFRPDGVTVEVPMMKQKADFKIYTGDNFVLAEFPYGQGNFVMDVILPNENNGLSSVEASLTQANFRKWVEGLRERETDLSFPRFKYGYKKQLKSILSDMGMGIAFYEGADFSNISDLDLLINDVTHQAFIETNEEGTEAAAATIVDIGLTSMPLTPFMLNIDHAFIYIIRETTTNTILFMGKVADPTKN